MKKWGVIMEFLEVIIQTVLAFFTILFVTRLLGRQQISQLTLYEYINGITFGSIAANLATDLNQKTYQHLVGLVLFGALTGIVSYISLKNRPFRKVVEGEPILAIHEGKLLEQNLKKARYSVDELNELLRKKDCFNINDIQYGILEINGELSVIKKPEKDNVKIEDLAITKPKGDGIATELIIGGQIIYENLQKKNLKGKDLLKVLKNYNIKEVSEVMYCTIDTNGDFYVDKYQDNLQEKVDFSENNQNV
jgi:uncharacterized membrane protein YcaP (DUF421 family)